MKKEKRDQIKHLGSIQSFLDVTYQQTLEALHDSEAKFQGLAESSPVSIFVFQNNKLRYVNPEFVTITGYSEADCLNMNFWEFIHPDCQSLVKDRGIARQRGDSASAGRYETKLLSRSGKIIWVDLYANRINYKGQSAVIGLLYNISERKSFEEALHQSEAMYRTIFETTGTAMIIFDENKLITLVNTEFERLSGYSKDEIQNKKHWPEVVAKEDIERMEEYHRLRRIKSEVTPSSYEFKLVDRKGSLKDIFITVNIIPGTTDSVCSFMNITERKKAEEQVRYLSFHDKMTRLYNRAFFEEELNRLDTSRQLPISLIIGDVNGLKLINDAFGHANGDRLLIRVAEILTQSCRADDIVARWGGDEFIILLPKTDEKTALKICERIKEITGNASNFPIPISISLGQSLKTSSDQNMGQIIIQAEDKMYRNKLLENKSARSTFVTSLERTLWEKSHETNEHCQRLIKMAEQVGKEIDLPAGDLDNLKLLATLHDLGKIAIPNSILDKIDTLSLNEWEIIKKHPETGYRIALTLPELAPIAEAILAHHERWDGCGYPLGLKEKDIPQISRILAIVDAYDVMIQGRIYKKALNKEEAIAEIQKCAGTQFEPELVKVFVDFIRER
ncbi:MAG: diguanylate cyclase [Firmicutes bacterium HGW-Firmicutes-15]|nr:MAG: diguanylate cyclase [Firmicutes bacterium HGW-Firmicutes-15]